MATLKEIKIRINSIKSTEKITRAMKMVAAVKFRKAQESILSARPYAKKIGEILSSLSKSVENIDNDLLTEREVNKVCIILVTSDRGLCGSFNTNLIKYAENAIKTTYADYYNTHNLTMVCIGRKGYTHFFKRQYDIFARYISVFDKLDFFHAKDIVSEIISGYMEKKFDKIVFIYQEFKNAATTKVVEEQFLPIPSISTENENEHIVTNYIFEPSAREIINTLLPRHLNTQAWRVLLESNASEQASRMTAMESATKNANDLMKELQLFYNKARQTAITKEILEVSGGAEALKEVN